MFQIEVKRVVGKKKGKYLCDLDINKDFLHRTQKIITIRGRKKTKYQNLKPSIGVPIVAQWVKNLT